MSNFKFVSHEEFPDDLYVKEIVYLSFDDKYRVAYARKPTKNGGAFWSVLSAGVMKNGTKNYYDSFLQDSSFLAKDIQNFLSNGSWKTKVSEDIDVPF